MKTIFETAFAKAEDSFLDAQLLFSNKRYSAAINRCYYSIYYIANTLLLDKDIHVKTHSGIIRKFSEIFIQTGELPGRLISIYSKIFEKRQIADYDMEYHPHADEAEKILAEAREFIDIIRDILK